MGTSFLVSLPQSFESIVRCGTRINQSAVITRNVGDEEGLEGTIVDAPEAVCFRVGCFVRPREGAVKVFREAVFVSKQGGLEAPFFPIGSVETKFKVGGPRFLADVMKHVYHVVRSKCGACRRLGTSLSLGRNFP